jgi:hypothetical protein
MLIERGGEPSLAAALDRPVRMLPVQSSCSGAGSEVPVRARYMIT